MNQHSSPTAAAVAALAPTDVQAVCRTLKLPLPTPDVSLLSLLDAAHLTPADVLPRLERSADVGAMIAAAALRGSVRRCPPDARLSPKPYPRAPVKKPLTPEERTRTARPEPPARRVAGSSDRVLVSVAPNPKKAGSSSRDRYAKYRVGMTEAEALAAGILPADVRWDTERGFLKWEARA